MNFTSGQSAEFQIAVLLGPPAACCWVINQLFSSAAVVTIYYKYIALPVKFILDGIYFSVCLKFQLKNAVLKGKI
jgi:hypothetical protein